MGQIIYSLFKSYTKIINFKEKMNNLKKSFTSSERAHTENIQVQVDPDDTISMDNMCGYIYDKSMSPCKSSEVKSKLSISQD
jgi:hypothetical protein